MGIALAVTVLVGLMGSSLTWLWFRMSNEKHAESEFASQLKKRRATFEESVHTAEQQMIRKVVGGDTVDN